MCLKFKILVIHHTAFIFRSVKEMTNKIKSENCDIFSQHLNSIHAFLPWTLHNSKNLVCIIYIINAQCVRAHAHTYTPEHWIKTVNDQMTISHAITIESH